MAFHATRHLLPCGLIVVLTGAGRPALLASGALPPAPQREFRGAWIASVGNINWPSKPGLPVSRQKGELTAILDRAVELRLNAVILQVRPGCDALYDSKLEPWSEFLTGVAGQAPSPAYDPLAFAVAEAHARGLELHAWFNPFRARSSSAKSPPSADHISQRRPELVRSYGRQLWLDPGEPAVHEHSLAVIADVVWRYDIDGIHIDDYFYPYPERDANGAPVDFPDDASWKRYQAGGGKLARDDWRRDNVDRFVEAMYRRVKAAKPWVKVGISPFGIWRPGHPPQIKGLDAYAQLYADARKWLASGWLDYFTPQLYWAIDAPEQSYPVLLKWWNEQNTRRRHLWAGNSLSRVVAGTWKTDEIVNQIELTRRQAGAGGNVFFNWKALASGPLGAVLTGGVYREPALVPASPWLDADPPGRPAITAKRGQGNGVEIEWQPAGSEPVWQWVVQVNEGGAWQTFVLPGRSRGCAVKASSGSADSVAVTAVDRCGNAGVPAILGREALAAGNGTGQSPKP